MSDETLRSIRRELHQIPELGFQETKTQQYLLDKLTAWQTERVQVKKWKTGLLVRIAGTNPKKTIGFRSDIDALPITEDTGLAFSSTHAGRMHACGHDFHMTIALGSIHYFVENPPVDNLLFVFQPAEEGPGGALPMLQSDVFQAWFPDIIFALHIAPELPVGTVSSKEGLLFANTSELFIDFKGKGGHAAYPHLAKDMTVAASQFVVQLQQVISRGIDPLESALITIGKMESGYVQNAIAETARLEGTIRTLSPQTMPIIKDKLQKLIDGFSLAYECEIDVDYGANYYQVYNDASYVHLFSKVMKENDIKFDTAPAAMTGEDFGYMLKEIPGFMFWLGVSSPYGLHHAQLNPNEDALSVGVKAVVQTIAELTVNDA
ncbi:N-acetyldiaminopimelate deacetylase [Oceanobacillus picturae]|uniref:N-acetyldiaminopimelate deacetylase n=1 Tax=Oceanobacillus picturae TaxID=171693 RepID=W9AI83_9BACI|nr:N-acetyldiaminopimelate deacetylase [Oceanobacillus picturae]RIU96518.1 N-acetyldiaminopimelate deacetylase [Oceanobacillus picturae]GAQ18770.1 N-acetyldiaminopimelate deacetylase [Oceanobacillus picturae]CDO02391.1 N-acetyldiaminopimelate deacetylase [Oceanobacillus picturae]